MRVLIGIATAVLMVGVAVAAATANELKVARVGVSTFGCDDALYVKLAVHSRAGSAASPPGDSLILKVNGATLDEVLKLPRSTPLLRAHSMGEHDRRSLIPAHTRTGDPLYVDAYFQRPDRAVFLNADTASIELKSLTAKGFEGNWELTFKESSLVKRMKGHFIAQLQSMNEFDQVPASTRIECQ